MNKISVLSCGILDNNVQGLDLLELQDSIATLKHVMMTVLKENKTGLIFEYPSFFFETSYNKHFDMSELSEEEKVWAWFFKIQFRMKTQKIEPKQFKEFLKELEAKMNELLGNTQNVLFTKVVMLLNSIEEKSLTVKKLS